MRAEGVVISVDGDVAEVSVIQQSACAGCSASCASCHKQVVHKIFADNGIDATVGEHVWVESSGARLLLLCALLFVLPPVFAGICCSLLWGSVTNLVLVCITFGVAIISFSTVYLTVGKKMVASNKYVLAKKY